jgi:superfamily II DNA or RNA helicase/HKD family nuclease
VTVDFVWFEPFAADVTHGYLAADSHAPRRHHPEVVLNDGVGSALRALRHELASADRFTFSVAFVSSSAIAMLKQELLDFDGPGMIITSDYLGFNSPAAFKELLHLEQFGVEVRIHRANGFHPKGYIFQSMHSVTAMVGSSNLTANALVRNHEWNLRVSAARGSDLGQQLIRLTEEQREDSFRLTADWIDQYERRYVAAAPRAISHSTEDTILRPTADLDDPTPAQRADEHSFGVVPNAMQAKALESLSEVRLRGEPRALLISATGTGKTILSALDVRAAKAERMLFVVHREQILDRTIAEYRRVLGGPPQWYGKVSGSSKQTDARFVFATVQTLSREETLQAFDPGAFDYIVIDEVHRAGAASHLKIIEHFSPKFLLGMSATPERTDGFNIFELFNYVVPYEIRLTHALEEEMLSPFHYYGIADVIYDDGTTISGDCGISRLITPERVEHLLDALNRYSQAGVAPRGLIFCSRRDEAYALSVALNESTLRGRPLRTAGLTGSDSVASREEVVRKFEAGDLDYLLTVDVFNEGVDIPTVNQVVMLRQTQSPIVFVQQLGRGLRKAVGKEFLVVIDFIGNYANNFMIPIALFGDESLNKESLRKNLIAAEEAGFLPGLSSVRFDKISQQRVLESITDTALDSTARLKAAIDAMRNRVGGTPRLWDFLRFESVDPVTLATKREHFPALLNSLAKIDHDLSPSEHSYLTLLSHEVLPAKRLHEFIVLEELIAYGTRTWSQLRQACEAIGIPCTPAQVQSAVYTLSLAQHAEADQKRYKVGIVSVDAASVSLSDTFLDSYTSSGTFTRAVSDILQTGRELVRGKYLLDLPFTPGMQYTRKETTRLLNLPRKWTSTLYGYKADLSSGVCPIFVTLHKSDEVSASTAYEDAILDRSTMRWYSKHSRTLRSEQERAIASNELDLHVFVKKDDAQGRDFYYLGKATARNATETTMRDATGKSLPVVTMELKFPDEMNSALFDYFHPQVSVS